MAYLFPSLTSWEHGVVTLGIIEPQICSNLPSSLVTFDICFVELYYIFPDIWIWPSIYVYTKTCWNSSGQTGGYIWEVNNDMKVAKIKINLILIQDLIDI